MTIRHERVKFPPRGLLGGSAGAAGREYVNDEKIPAKVRMELSKGDVLRFDTPGGGGMGPAADRDLVLIERDIANGLVTPAAAARDYRVMPEKVANSE